MVKKLRSHGQQPLSDAVVSAKNSTAPMPKGNGAVQRLEPWEVNGNQTWKATLPALRSVPSIKRWMDSAATFP